MPFVCIVEYMSSGQVGMRQCLKEYEMINYHMIVDYEM